MNPYQIVSARWPRKISNKVFDMFMQGYTAPEITKATRVPENTIYDWSHKNGWAQIRRETVTNYEDRAKLLLNTSIYGVVQACQGASKLLTHIETCLDDENVSEGGETGTLDSEDLKNIATALEKSADVLLRIFGK